MAYFSVQLLKWPWNSCLLSIIVVDFALSWFFLSNIYMYRTHYQLIKAALGWKKCYFLICYFLSMASNFFFQKSNFEKKALKIFFFNEKSLQKLFFNVTIYVTELQMKYQGLNLRFQGFIAFKLWRVQNVGKKYPKKATVFLVTSSAISYETIIFPCSINLDLYRKIIILTTGLIV